VYVAPVVLNIRTHHSRTKANNVRVLAAVGAGYIFTNTYHTYIPWACSYVEGKTRKEKEKSEVGG
jgi:hypothetical protein